MATCKHRVKTYEVDELGDMQDRGRGVASAEVVRSHFVCKDCGATKQHWGVPPKQRVWAPAP